jgi:serine/threonine-protein kinase
MLDAMSGSALREPELEVGDKLGPYVLEEVLGQGGVGIVFRAVHADDGLTSALKVLKIQLTKDATYRQRFVHEARAAAAVRHNHLVPIMDAGEIDGRSYLAVAYVQGCTLRERIQRRGPLPPADSVRVAGQAAAGLDALHAAGLVHRDVKSSNILLEHGDTALLTDFGLARGHAYTVLTKPGQVMGTLDYLAPELIRGEAATPASDIYALGCTVYESVVGRTPFGDRTVFEVGIAHLEEVPAAPTGVPESLSWAILQALEKEPTRRPPTATAYSNMLAIAAR